MAKFFIVTGGGLDRELEPGAIEGEEATASEAAKNAWSASTCGFNATRLAHG
jgi:hypothetical protein